MDAASVSSGTESPADREHDDTERPHPDAEGEVGVPEQLNGTPPTVKVCYLVLRLHDDDVLSTQELIQTSRCSGSSVRRALDALRERGFVERVVDVSRDMQQRYYRLAR